ncbi:FAD-dependent oxidoreductase [Candidatus Uabimicrobium sp. HlEnr_7]|uniref:glycerol-3-phosphate dehydrogenase/oxidase n=1 Tax=Candidatus Uabimicrobium helgolandensis TaxID=3095367 RepID=UPI003558CD64
MSLRNTNIDKLQRDFFDVLVIGGGINGASCVAALANKGIKVALIDQADFASETSQSSSNLVWGGIKYLEGFEFSLVRKLCLSRNKLCRSFPSSVKEIRFFTIHNHNTRLPRFFLYLGTWLYWVIGNGFTKKPKIFNRKFVENHQPMINTEKCSGGIEYSDAYLVDNDSRFVFNFMRSAMRAGAVCANYVQAKESVRDTNGWATSVIDLESGRSVVARSKIIINACGPYVDVYNEKSKQNTVHQHIFSKGIHLIVKRITFEEKVLTFFADDGRMFFVVPMGDKSCIGTTDTRVDNPKTKVTQEDRDFVLSNINSLLSLEEPLTYKDIISERCGVRPLVVKNSNENADWLKLSRKHVVEVSDCFISIFGGKLTDCVNVGDEICEHVKKLGIDFGCSKPCWYGESSQQRRIEFLDRANTLQLPQKHAERWWRFFDEDAFELLENLGDVSQELLIPEIGFYRCEIEFVKKYEMITKLSDFLRRRTNLAMVINKENLINHQGIYSVAQLLFDELFTEKWDEYFSNTE